MPEFQLGSPEDSQELLRLFAFVFDKVKDEQSQFEFPQGIFLRWIKERGPSLEDLRAGLSSNGPPSANHRWLPQIADPKVWRTLKGGPFLKTLEASVKAAPVFGVDEGKEICRLLAAIAQTLLSSDLKFKKHNELIYRDNIVAALEVYRLAQQKKPSAPPPPNHPLLEKIQVKQPITPTPRAQTAEPHPITKPVQIAQPPPQPAAPPVERPKLWPFEHQPPTYRCLFTRSVSLWHASHVGPSYAEKGENQDATFACTDGPRFIFALSDGVSTSYGSRFSAVSIVSVFCEKLQRILAGERRASRSLLEKAALETHAWLNSALHFFISNPNAPEWNEFKGDSKMSADVALRFCENTLDPKNRFWGPVMAATLLGGVVQPSEDGRSLDMFAIRVGDGVIEEIENFGSNGLVKPLLAMDSKETEITASLSPGPLGEKSLANPEIIEHSIAPGNAILIASDGLTRGHDKSVSQQLRDMAKSARIVLPPEDHAGALSILQNAAKFAEAEFKNDPPVNFFNDNLSLIVLLNTQNAQSSGGGR